MFIYAYQFYHNTAFIRPNLQKYFHQDNLSFACLYFYERKCPNILAGNISFSIQASNQ